jgi:hypothetical protein
MRALAPSLRGQRLRIFAGHATTQSPRPRFIAKAHARVGIYIVLSIEGSITRLEIIEPRGAWFGSADRSQFLQSPPIVTDREKELIPATQRALTTMHAHRPLAATGGSAMHPRPPRAPSLTPRAQPTATSSVAHPSQYPLLSSTPDQLPRSSSRFLTPREGHGSLPND